MTAIVATIFLSAVFTPLLFELLLYAVAPQLFAVFAYLPLQERTVILPQADLGRHATSRGYRASAAQPLALAVLGSRFSAKCDDATLDIDARTGNGALRLVDANAFNRILAVARIQVVARDAEIGMRVTFIPVPFFSPFFSLVALAFVTAQLSRGPVNYAFIVAAAVLTVVLAARIGSGARQRLTPAARWAMDEVERAILARRALEVAKVKASPADDDAEEA